MHNLFGEDLAPVLGTVGSGREPRLLFEEIGQRAGGAEPGSLGDFLQAKIGCGEQFLGEFKVNSPNLFVQAAAEVTANAVFK